MSSIKDVENYLHINIDKYINSIEEIKDKNDESSALFKHDGKKILRFKKNLNNADIIKENDKKNYEQLLLNPDIPQDILTNDKYSAKVKTKNDLKRLVIHELGHVIADDYENIYNLFANYALNGGLVACEATCRELSLYACFNNSEFFAESFADMIMNKDKSSIFGKKLKNFLKEYYDI